MLTKGKFTRDEWNHLLNLLNIGHFSSAVCSAALAKRIQQESGEERVRAKSRPMMKFDSEDAISRVVFNFVKLGEDMVRISTMVRHRPIQGESTIHFLGEPEGSLTQPQDSFPDAREAINDFWSMSGSSIYRHHVEPRVKLYSPREESFPTPLKYIDVSRTTHTNLDVKQEKRIDDFWNIDGSRDLSDSWTGFTHCTLLEEKAPDGKMWSGGD